MGLRIRGRAGILTAGIATTAVAFEPATARSRGKCADRRAGARRRVVGLSHRDTPVKPYPRRGSRESHRAKYYSAQAFLHRSFQPKSPLARRAVDRLHVREHAALKIEFVPATAPRGEVAHVRSGCNTNSTPPAGCGWNAQA